MFLKPFKAAFNNFLCDSNIDSISMHFSISEISTLVVAFRKVLIKAMLQSRASVHV